MNNVSVINLKAKVFLYLKLRLENAQEWLPDWHKNTANLDASVCPLIKSGESHGYVRQKLWGE